MIYQRIFATRDAVAIHDLFVTNMELAERLGPQAAATLVRLRSAHQAFIADMDRVARTTAQFATRAMRARLDATASPTRGGTGRTPNLKMRLTARALHHALPDGAVGIAPEDVLDRVLDPLNPQYGSYWRAQERGTGAAGGPGQPPVPSQLGRVIRGYFFGAGYSGGGVRPSAQFAGGAGIHPLFVSARVGAFDFGRAGMTGGIGSRGGLGGFGTIRREIRGRHFIRDGADLAEAEWRLQMRAAERAAITRLAPIR